MVRFNFTVELKSNSFNVLTNEKREPGIDKIKKIVNLTNKSFLKVDRR
jgi:hypothetical protein